jgi:Zn-dependent oligopeptidase
VRRAPYSTSARFRSGICQRLDLYEAIRAVVPPGPVEERLRADLLRRFEHAGAHLDEPDRRRVTAINTRLADLASDFMANLRAADAASGVIAEDVAGLADGLVAAARAAAAERGLAGYFVPYSEHNAAVVLAQAEDRTVREEMYRLTVACTAEANGPVVAEILALRQELAELLGYPDFVELHRASRMVADPQALLDELAAAYGPQADREHAELVAFARSYTRDERLELTAADVDNPLDGFYATKLRESLGLGSTASVRVPVETARQVLLDALAELYTVTFTRSDAPGWQPDVEVFDLHDPTGRIRRQPLRLPVGRCHGRGFVLPLCRRGHPQPGPRAAPMPKAFSRTARNATRPT